MPYAPETPAPPQPRSLVEARVVYRLAIAEDTEAATPLTRLRRALAQNALAQLLLHPGPAKAARRRR